MGNWQSYRLEDFIPFSPEIYWRLVERINEAFWPLHILTAALGVAALTLALRGNTRVALALLAPAWLSSGIIFHFEYYAELNWAAPWFGWSFIVQAALLTAIAATNATPREPGHSGKVTRLSGAAITIGALLAYPLITAETYGLHPDPTAIATLGILLVSLRGVIAWLAILIPTLWCLVSTLTLIPLEAAWAPLPLAVAIVSGAFLIMGTDRRED
ncbi:MULTISPECIES: DUF6064 family protein [unclassified Wenzhouxiangella]|uniref:DUF6064 family protein n=1 Tax=unclassified Wenzhouxiangella TaxID=2613841 RepID=UPI000E329444|nr:MULTISPECIES: DUF6064 family protein [unclassified Wenzhouxiangella]RFF28215.1 MFS transporter permease [Wenzhouxiangella sp. 15181]RFP67890.1 MFS transporter permease [Wenzhouxiangella sp. 15190]